MSQCEKGIDCLECNSRGMCSSYADFKYQQGYNTAIDEFMNKIYDVSDFVRNPNLISGGYSVATLENIEKIAEQMKKSK